MAQALLVGIFYKVISAPMNGNISILFCLPQKEFEIYVNSEFYFTLQNYIMWFFLYYVEEASERFMISVCNGFFLHEKRVNAVVRSEPSCFKMYFTLTKIFGGP